MAGVGGPVEPVVEEADLVASDIGTEQQER